jgi:4-amino-4-deoxy-L-arabinose transferase-like glycosyltransferase
MTQRRRDAWVAFAVGLTLRLAVVAWACGRLPPVEDGHYYDLLARRLANGDGYTWLWPDGVVTYAAHYPVGYPAMLAAAYVVFGASNAVAMALNSLLGAASVFAAHRLVDRPDGPRWRPLAAALVVALHPALVPYTAALMTEGVTASLLVVAIAIANRARTPGREWSLLATGIVMGVATLVRPQSLLLAPVLGALAAPASVGVSRRLARAAAVAAVAIVCVAPWTARNCVRMGRCALVSVNGGWNLLIGATTTSGGWERVTVPPPCATIWDEAKKDSCFQRAAYAAILSAPGSWLARAPGKVAMTLDYFGAGPWYLHASNGDRFGAGSKLALQIIETIASRLLLLGALVACARLPGRRPGVRKVVSLAGGAAALTTHGWLGYAAIPISFMLMGRRAAMRAPMVVGSAAAAIAETASVHAVFFGAGRYGLVVAPLVAVLAFARSQR